MLDAAKAKGVINGVAGLSILKDNDEFKQIVWRQIGNIDRDPRAGETMQQATNYLVGGLAKYGQSVRTLMDSGTQVGEPKRGENNLRGCRIRKIGKYTVWAFFSGHPDQNEDNAIADVAVNLFEKALT